MTANKVTKEIRLAVVLYGGTSLAIYINGVAQELYKMVRATSGTEDELSPSEQVYKQIGEELGVKFVVDVLSGTSAGGINAVYLAKALVRNQKMDGIQQVWIEEGDIGKLINDGESNQDLPSSLRKVLNAKSKKSLLNGQRMYFKLLDALDGMDSAPQNAGSPVNGDSALVQELDLFITATDLNGFTNPIRLSNNVVNENRYRSVFRFRYGKLAGSEEKEYDDFKVEDNPYLAFAARCTSSLPFVFETMTLKSVRDVLKNSHLNKYEQYLPGNGEKWKKYFLDYARRDPDFSHFEGRAFGDGGYLDNKPFSYATSAILNRWADAPVDRKLIYVEPAPEHPEEQAQTVPDALEHVMLALSSLPRTEPITDDIQFIKQRNQVIERARNYQKYAIEGLVSRSADRKKVDELWMKWKSSNTGRVKWPGMSLNASVKKYGFTYYNYHHIRVALTTDHVAGLVTRALGLDEETENLAAVRMLVQAWREENFATNPKPSQGPGGKRTRGESENQFMYQMDMEYRIRRLRFMLHLINTLAAFDGEANPKTGTDSDKSSAILKGAGYTFPKRRKSSRGRKPPQERAFPLEAFRQDLNDLRKEFNTILYKLFYYGRDIREDTPISKHIQFVEKSQQEEIVLLRGEMNTPKVSNDDLKAILALSLDTTLERERRRELLAERVSNWSQFDAYFNRLRNLIHKILRGVSAEAMELLGRKPRSIAYKCLKFYYEHYDYFDVMTLPLIAGTSAGEADVIDIIRVSPEDASSRINPANKRTKLKGAMFGNFGGFFATDWRREDILWGRLDAADIIVRSLRDDARERLKEESGKASEEQLDRWLEERVDKAQAAILRQNFFRSDSTLPKIKEAYKKAALGVMEGFNRQAGGDTPVLNENVIPAILDKAMIDDKFILDLFVGTPKSATGLPADVTASNAARTVQVIGKVLEDLSEKYSMLGKPGVWLSRLGLMVWSVVEFSLPNKLLNVLFHYWVGLFYLAEALVIVLGWIFGKPEIINTGWIAAGLTAFTHLVTVILKDVFTRQNRK